METEKGCQQPGVQQKTTDDDNDDDVDDKRVSVNVDMELCCVLCSYLPVIGHVYTCIIVTLTGIPCVC